MDEAATTRRDIAASAVSTESTTTAADWSLSAKGNASNELRTTKIDVSMLPSGETAATVLNPVFTTSSQRPYDPGSRNNNYSNDGTIVGYSAGYTEVPLNNLDSTDNPYPLASLPSASDSHTRTTGIRRSPRKPKPKKQSKTVRFAATLSETVCELTGEFLNPRDINNECGAHGQVTFASPTGDINGSIPDNSGSNSIRAPVMQYASFEEVLDYVGAFGRHQFLFAILTQWSVLAWCGNYVFMSYAILEPHWSCDAPIGSNRTNATKLGNCDILEECNEGNLTVTRDFYGITEEFGLYCHHDYIPNLILTIEKVGFLVGSQFAGYLADHWGRRCIFLVSHTVYIILSLCTLLTHEWVSFAVLRCIGGFFASASQLSCFTWGMELTNTKHNLIMNLASMWQFIYMFSAVVGFVVGYWRKYLIVINVLAFLVVPIFFWFGESPRWLIQKRRIAEAATSINQILKRNRGSDPSRSKVPVQAQSLNNIRVDLKDRHYSMLHLFSTRSLAMYTSILTLVVFTASLVANTFLYNLKHLAGNPFMDIFLYGAFRSWIPFAVWTADKYIRRFGRRSIFFMGMGTIAACFAIVVTLFEVEKIPGELLRPITAFGIIGAVMCSPLWICVGQYQTELFPTVIRNIAVGFLGIGSEVGGLFAPQILYLEKTWPSLPHIVTGVIVFITLAAGAYMLPETKGKALPDTIHSAHTLSPWEEHQNARKPEDFFSLVDEDHLANSFEAANMEEENS